MSEGRSFFISVIKRVGWIIPSSIVTGVLVAFFLISLEYVTTFRFEHPWIIWLLPVAGILITWLYLFKKSASAGNDLIIGEIHDAGEGVPPQITPLIMITTLITHLFGGSAGREGTAVQMGGGITAWFFKKLRIDNAQKGLLLTCGIAAGFGAVFGTPLAASVFAIEVLAIGKIKHHAILYCLLAAVVADLTCRLAGGHHTSYKVLLTPAVHKSIRWISTDSLLLLKVIAAGCVFGYASRLFSFTSHFTKDLALKVFPGKWLRPIVGGSLVLVISYVIGNFSYLGLGVSNPDPHSVTILSAFEPGGATYLSWFWKLVLTVITLGFGFKGGEVTPLFFIGATLGNILAVISGAPVAVFAAIGFLAVFSGATNTPLACTIMGVELFGTDNVLLFAAGCFAAYFCSGHTGIYRTQKRWDNQ